MRALAGFLALAVLGACAASTPAPAVAHLAAVPAAQGFIAAAVDDPARPQVDRDRDAARKPADMLAFAQLQPGAKVAELLPGGGYFTRLFSAAIGPEGRVYAIVSPQQAANTAQPPAVNAIAADPHYANVRVDVSPFGALRTPEPVDLFWTSQNYHDLHLTRLNIDVAAFNRAVFAALKPGGVFIVLDHAATPGAGLNDVDTLHRIDEAVVRSEVEAAGFVFEASDPILHNPNDAHTANVFEPVVRGHTDQFVLRFRKPSTP